MFENIENSPYYNDLTKINTFEMSEEEISAYSK
jgi:hypothetical protein